MPLLRQHCTGFSPSVLTGKITRLHQPGWLSARFSVSILFADFTKSRSPLRKTGVGVSSIFALWHQVNTLGLLWKSGSLSLPPPPLLCLSSTPPSVSTTQSSSHTCTHFPQLVSAFSGFWILRKRQSRGHRSTGLKYEVKKWKETALKAV